MKSLLKNKKGSIQDVFLITIILFVAALALFFVMFLANKVNDNMSPVFNSIVNNSGVGMEKVAIIANTGFDYMFLALFIGYIISLIITSFLMRTHPIFIPIFIIMLVLGIILAVILSNTYNSIVSNPDLASYANNLKITGFIMDKLPFVFAILGIVALIILFSKAREPSGMGGMEGMQ